MARKGKGKRQPYVAETDHGKAGLVGKKLFGNR